MNSSCWCVLYYYVHTFFLIRGRLLSILVPGLSTTSAFSFAFQEKDPVVTDVTLAILKLHENDFLVKLKRKWWDNANECRQEKEISMKALCLALMPHIFIANNNNNINNNKT